MIYVRKLYILPVLFIILFASCSDENKTDNLRFIESKITNFSIYAGTEEVKEHKFDSSKIFAPIYEQYATDAYILFDDDFLYMHQGVNVKERSQYRFVNDSLLFISTGGVEQYYGRGNKKKLVIRQHYVSYKAKKDSFPLFEGVAKDKFTFQDALKSMKVDTIPKVGDTIMWCTRESYFQ